MAQKKKVTKKGAKKKTSTSKNRRASGSKKTAARRSATPTGQEPVPPAGPVMGSVCWTELNTTDPVGAREFYRDLLNWETNTVQMGEIGDYTMVRPGKGQPDLGGIVRSAPGIASHWLSYFWVPDVDEAVMRAEGLGARIVLPATDIAVGRFAILTDPTGAQFALFHRR